MILAFLFMYTHFLFFIIYIIVLNYLFLVKFMILMNIPVNTGYIGRIYCIHGYYMQHLYIAKFFIRGKLLNLIYI